MAKTTNFLPFTSGCQTPSIIPVKANIRYTTHREDSVGIQNKQIM